MGWEKLLVLCIYSPVHKIIDFFWGHTPFLLFLLSLIMYQLLLSDETPYANIKVCTDFFGFFDIIISISSQGLVSWRRDHVEMYVLWPF